MKYNFNDKLTKKNWTVIRQITERAHNYITIQIARYISTAGFANI